MKRDFARVLEIYQEVVAAEEGAKRSSSSSGKKPPPPPPPSTSLQSKSPQPSSGSGSAANTSASTSTKSNPIIVVPNAMTSAITMINAGFFLGKDAVFIPRDQAMQNPLAGKRGGTISITRKLAPRLGGADITYDIIDNPATRLKKDEWNQVVAVICQGAAWQFKGWRYSDPVDLFSRTFGFYVGLEGASVPNELRGWNVKTGKVSRDRRGLDNVCLASFWNGLEEFMAVHKQDFIKST
jgi:parafibromin